MSEKTFIRPTESELEILQILWAHGLSNVKFLNELLNQKRVVGYTTTLKTIQLMHEKGLVKRQRGFWKSHDYEAAVNQTEVQSQLLNEFVANTFGGSMTKLMMQALGNQANKVHDLAEIKAFIQEMEEKNR
jgi:BlaI family transcriptional regulator, penicillinase repressor